MSTQPTDAELKAMWQIHAADIGGIFYYARAVLAKWGSPVVAGDVDRADAVNLARNALTQYDCAITKKGVRVLAEAVLSMDSALTTPQPTQPQPVAREPLTDEQVSHVIELFSCGAGKGHDVHGIARTIEAEVRKSDEALTGEQIKALMQAHRTAMLMTCKARVPECGEFAAIAQDLDWLCESFGIKGGQHVS